MRRRESEEWSAGVSPIIFLFILSLPLSNSANWAQTTGKLAQKVVIPRIPTPAYRHWTQRYGHAVVVASNSSITKGAQIYLLGGDTFEGDTSGENANDQQSRWTVGYKNDVWSSTGTEWSTHSDVHMKSRYDQKIPEVQSQMVWELTLTGERPTPGVTYDDWLKCQPSFRFRLPDPSICNSPEYQYKVQWSPRRHHAATFFKGYIWVLGGRARELADLPESESIGGVIGNRVADIYRERFGINFDQWFTNQREVSILKSDVWRSRDGVTWELVTPGCRAPQLSLVAKGNAAEQAAGTLEARCQTDLDCYSPAESCLPVDGVLTCVCSMWGPREQHTVSVFRNFMYVIGGYGSALFSRMSNCGAFACGDMNAGSYRYYHNDIWRSSDGEIWHAVNLGSSDTFFPGRGGHQVVILPNRLDTTKALFYLFGGSTGNPLTNEVTHLNDIWYANSDNPGVWRKLDLPVPWAPRTGHTVTLETPSAVNENKRIIYLIGGVTPDGSISDEVWVWWPDGPQGNWVPGDSTTTPDIWRKDFTPEARFRTALGRSGLYKQGSPSVYYLTPDSNITYLRKFWVPTPDNEAMRRDGTLPDIRKYLTPEKLAMLESVGVYTIRQLAEADKYIILKLRGFDFPQVPMDKRLNFEDICDFRELAKAVVDKCSVDTSKRFFENEEVYPWNNNPVFGGPAPLQLPAEWENRIFTDYIKETDPVILVEEWDGCARLPLRSRPNVNGIGRVDQVDSIRKPLLELQELHCKFTPGQRAYHSAAYYEERLYLFGGRQTENKLMGDSWYRDDRLPTVNIKTKPESNTPQWTFRFAADEPGCIFEYRIWDINKFKEIRPWTSVLHKTSISWLDWREGGPGNGRYALYVRAIDPSGNRDEMYEAGRNVYAWNYVSPTPWDIIFGCIAGFIFLAFLAYLEYRRRVKKAAMERYAMKRMRRKFKAMQRDLDGRAVDWRTLYQEHKDLQATEDKEGKKRLQEMKKKREKAKEQREKERIEREKEKEKIRKKLKGKETKKIGGGSEASVSTVKTERVKQTSENYLSNSKKNLLEAGEKPNKRLKDYEVEGEGTMAITRADEQPKSKKRLKDYEIEDGGNMAVTKAGATATDSKPSTANKKLKDYEIEDEKSTGGGGKGGAAGAGAGTANKRLKDYEIEDEGGTGVARRAKSKKLKDYEIEEENPKNEKKKDM